MWFALWQPKWNNALLEMFRIDFIGTTPYITCTPFLNHHRLGPDDHFLVLSSDGLYQYMSNEEVISHVEWFMEKFPDGDPAQHLIEEVLFRAAKNAGKGEICVSRDSLGARIGLSIFISLMEINRFGLCAVL